MSGSVVTPAERWHVRAPRPAGEGVTAAKVQMYQSVTRSGGKDAVLHVLLTLNSGRISKL